MRIHGPGYGKSETALGGLPPTAFPLKWGVRLLSCCFESTYAREIILLVLVLVLVIKIVIVTRGDAAEYEQEWY